VGSEMHGDLHDWGWWREALFELDKRSN
jgi:hypothetical protein